MRVTISRRLHTSSSGMIRKTTVKYPLVSLKVDLSEEERATIAAWNLEETIVLDRELQPDQHDVSDGEANAYAIRIRHLLLEHPTETKFRSPTDALDFEEKLKERITVLKGYIDANARFSESTDTFEL